MVNGEAALRGSNSSALNSLLLSNEKHAAHLQHLYKSHVQVHVDEVTADHTGTVEQAYRYDRPEVELFGHANLVSSVEPTSRPGQNLGRQGGKDHVPDGQ